MNTVRSVVDDSARPLTIADLYESATPASGRDRQQYQAFKGRTQEWASGLVTDFSADEM